METAYLYSQGYISIDDLINKITIIAGCLQAAISEEPEGKAWQLVRKESRITPKYDDEESYEYLFLRLYPEEEFNFRTRIVTSNHTYKILIGFHIDFATDYLFYDFLRLFFRCEQDMLLEITDISKGNIWSSIQLNRLKYSNSAQWIHDEKGEILDKPFNITEMP